MSVKMTQKKCLQEIFSEVLWNDLNISSKGDSLYNQYLVDKGVVTVGDTISDKLEILTWGEAKHKYSLNSHCFKLARTCKPYSKKMERQA